MNNTDRFVAIPKSVLDRLSKKARKELEDAINTHREDGFERYPSNFGMNGGNQVMYSYHLIETQNDSANDAIQTILAMSYETKIAKLNAEKAKDSVTELAKIKESMKLLKGVINE